MADISKITTPNNISYDIKDSTARTELLSKASKIELTQVWDNLTDNYPADSTSGSVANFNTPIAKNLVSCVAQITAVQSGTGNPAPDNVRTISGWSACEISHSGVDTSNPTTYTINFVDGETPLTVYGGELDIVSGVLTITKVLNNNPFTQYSSSTNYKSYRTGTISNFTNINPLSNMVNKYSNFSPTQVTEPTCFIDSGSTKRIYVALPNNINVNNFQLVYQLATPIEIQLTPQQITTFVGENNIWADTGDIAVSFKDAPKAKVAITGSYNDLSNKPTIPAAQVNSDWNASSGVAQILNKPTLGTASTLDYDDSPTPSAGPGQVVTGADTRFSTLSQLETIVTTGAYYGTSNIINKSSTTYPFGNVDMCTKIKEALDGTDFTKYGANAGITYNTSYINSYTSLASVIHKTDKICHFWGYIMRATSASSAIPAGTWLIKGLPLPMDLASGFFYFPMITDFSGISGTSTVTLNVLAGYSNRYGRIYGDGSGSVVFDVGNGVPKTGLYYYWNIMYPIAQS